MRIVVTGAAGQLGALTVERLAPKHEVVALTREDVDLTDHLQVANRVTEQRPDLIINCAAYNNVDGAEDDASTALEVNAFAVRTLARAAAETGAAFVHYSTDFVFDGTASQPYTEQDEPKPQSVYASSKLLGEWFARDAGKYLVLRVESLFGGPAPRSSVDKIADALLSHREARVFVDRIVSPSYVDDVAWATEELLTRGAAWGVYHCVNTGQVSWHDLAIELARLAEVEPRLIAVKVADVTLRARRPQFCALSNQKLRDLGIVMPPWQDSLARFLAKRSAKTR
jgi:dTDP-4-dehydrorhamnose reductase